jgi:hypothetical protein
MNIVEQPFAKRQLVRPRRRYEDEISEKDVMKVDDGGLGLCSVASLCAEYSSCVTTWLVGTDLSSNPR